MRRSQGFSLAIVLPLLLVCLADLAPGTGTAAAPGGVAPAGDRDPERRAEGTGKPHLRLKAEPAVGFTPLAVVVSGQLSGVGPGDANFCHPAVTWIRIDPGQSQDEGLRMREDPACLHPKEEVHVPTSFSKNYDLYRPGSYLFRLQVEGKDGTRIDSGFVKVEVLRVQ
jgi:hypothetical protein